MEKGFKGKMKVLSNGNKFVLFQIIVDINYSSNPTFFDAKISILKDLMIKYPEYNMQDQQQLIIQTKEPGLLQTTITPSKTIINYNIILSQNKDNFIADIGEIWAVIRTQMKIDKIDKFNIKFLFVNEMELSSSYNITKKFINKNLKTKFGIGVKQAQIVLNYEENGFNYLLTLNPGTYQNVNIVIGNGINSNQPQQKILFKTGLIASYDVSNKNYDANKFESSLNLIYNSVISKNNIIEIGEF